MNWQPIETAPKDGNTVVIGQWHYYDGYHWWPELAYWQGSQWWNGEGEPILGATHWMPLLPYPPTPEPPKP